MRWSALFKRFVPFFLTFTLGLFVASFFVSIAAPSFQFKNRGWKYREYKRMKCENDRLRERVQRLERERLSAETDFEMNLNVPPPPLPPAPPALSVPRRDR